MLSMFSMLDSMGTSATGKESSEPAVPYFLAFWNLVLRPPRAKYELEDLGPPRFEVEGVKGRRTDLSLTTDRGVLLECSFFVPEMRVKPKLERLPVVIYLHGNSSCRIEALEVLKALFHRRIAVFCYDSAACGKSQGDYVSLGHYEHQDLDSIVKYLSSRPEVGPIGIWGRSMGAVTTLLYNDTARRVSAICCDSAFSSLVELMWDVGKNQQSISLPPWLIRSVIALIRNRVRALAGFDIEDVVPLEKAKNRSVPALFVHAQQDSFIPVSHSRQLYEQYSGVKEFIEIGGDHNSPRAPKIVAFVADFFSRQLKKGVKMRPPPVKPGFDGSTSRLSWERGVPPVSISASTGQSLLVEVSQRAESARKGMGKPGELSQKAESARGVLQEIKAFSGAANLGCRKAIPIEKPRRHSHAPLRTPDKQMDTSPPPLIAPRGSCPRNPSPWPSPWRPECIFEDREVLRTPVTKSNTPKKRTTKKNIDQENVPPLGSLSGTKDKIAYTPGLVTPLPNGSPTKTSSHTPPYNTPLITPLASMPSAARTVASPQVADDPEQVCPVPSLTDPTLISARYWPVDNSKASPLQAKYSEKIYAYDPDRCNSRQRRHTIAFGSPDNKLSEHVRNNCHSMMPYPWLCCSANTVHESPAYV